MDRRSFLLGTAGAATLPLAAPALAQPAGARVLKFIPQADVAVIDPIVTTAYVTRNHGFVVYDTLYGMDAQFKPQPQMAEGHRVEEDGRRVSITLRSGLKFHDGAPVLAKDAVASIKRWWQRDAMGQALAAATEELVATDDRTLTFRLKKPFALLLDALGFPRDAFTAVFAMGRTTGWIAHAREQANSGRLIRPKSLYVGPMPKQAA